MILPITFRIFRRSCGHRNLRKYGRVSILGLQRTPARFPRRMVLSILTVSTLAVEGGPAAAGQGLESDVATLQVEVRSLREELNALRRELQRLTAPASAGEAAATEADRPASVPAVAASTALGESEESQEPSIEEAVPMLAAQVAEQAQLW